jgi:hypothetical protein
LDLRCRLFGGGSSHGFTPSPPEPSLWLVSFPLRSPELPPAAMLKNAAPSNPPAQPADPLEQAGHCTVPEVTPRSVPAGT